MWSQLFMLHVLLSHKWDRLFVHSDDKTDTKNFSRIACKSANPKNSWVKWVDLPIIAAFDLYALGSVLKHMWSSLNLPTELEKLKIESNFLVNLLSHFWRELDVCEWDSVLRLRCPDVVKS